MNIENKYTAETRYGRSLLSAAVALVIASSQLALAQDNQRNSVLEETVIIAERREGNVQDIPISMAVFSENQLQKKSVNRLDDLQFAAPSLSVTDSGVTQAYGRNLADKEYVTGQYLSFNNEFYGPPREYGVTFTYSFER